MRALSIEFRADRFVVVLDTDEKLDVPYSVSDRLLNASPEQRSTVRLICNGSGIHWPLLDEDLSVRGLFAQYKQGVL